MVYKKALQLKVGDVVYVRGTDAARKIIEIEIDEEAKSVFARCDNRIMYHHGILTLDKPAQVVKVDEPVVEKKLVYYQVQSYNKVDDIDEVCNSHIYPSYLTCFGVKGGLHKPIHSDDMNSLPLMIQSNPHDGLKFTKKETAEKMIDAAKKIWPKKEFEVVPFDARFYGRVTPRWIVVD